MSLQLSKFYVLRSELKRPTQGFMYPPDVILPYTWNKTRTFSILGHRDDKPLEYLDHTGTTSILVFDDTKVDSVLTVNITSSENKVEKGIIQKGITRETEYIIKDYEQYQPIIDIITDIMESFSDRKIAEIHDSHLKRFKLMCGTLFDKENLSILKYKPYTATPKGNNCRGMEYRCLCGLTKQRKNKGKICQACHTEVILCTND